MPLALIPQTFLVKWRKTALKGRSSYQEHFLDFRQLVGHSSPATADAEGTSFAFEYGTAKLGGQGFTELEGSRGRSTYFF